MPERLFDRHLRRDIVDALADSRAVAVLGARQVGKSTLVAQIAADEHPARLINLDDDATAATARADPTGFIADIDEPVAIDEIQRAPELLLAVKRRLDADQTRGQFLLSGSANILSLPTVADALPGRSSTSRCGRSHRARCAMFASSSSTISSPGSSRGSQGFWLAEERSPPRSSVVDIPKRKAAVHVGAPGSSPAT